MSDASLALFAEVVESSEFRSEVEIAATDGTGQFWPRRAADYISGLQSHSARALAFRAVPSEYRLMVRSMIYRAIVNASLR